MWLDIKKKASMIVAIFSSITILLIYNLINVSGAVEGINKSADAKREEIEFREEMSETVEGIFYDRNGVPLTYSETKGQPSKLLYEESLSHLIGYRSVIYGNSGLRQKYSHLLLRGGQDHIGADITLTLNVELQEFCYNLLEGREGSVSVINAETGEILAMASRSHGEIGFQANSIDDNFEKYNLENSFFLNRAIMNEDPPGSTFKVITSVALLENGMGDFTCYDKGYIYINKTRYDNFHGYSYGEIGLSDALKYSSNVYFADAGANLGYLNLERTAKGFMFGEDIKLDFCTLSSNFKSTFDKEAIAQTAFGQGQLTVSPLQITMMTASVINDGKMQKPYIIKEINDDGERYATGKSVFLSQTASKEASDKLCEYLHDTALHYGFHENLGYVIAKTGTAETHNGNHHIYLTAGIEIEGSKYALCIDYRNVSESSGVLKEPALQLLEYLSKMDS